jgi:hypothetical protein
MWQGQGQRQVPRAQAPRKQGQNPGQALDSQGQVQGPVPENGAQALFKAKHETKYVTIETNHNQ